MIDYNCENGQKLKTMKTYSFDAVLDLVESLSNDEQVLLMDLLRQRHRENRRDEIAHNIVQANEEYLQGKVFRGTVNDLMAELNR